MHSCRFQVSKTPSGLDFAQDESRMIHTTRGSHPIRSIHLLKHSLDPWERHNPNRNALRSVEIQFLNHLRKEILPPKGCLSGQGWHGLRHSPWCDAHAEMDFCRSISTSNALPISTGLESAVSRSSSSNSLCHLYIYIIVTSHFAVVGISRSFVSAPSARK